MRDPWPKTWIADNLHETNFIDAHDFDQDGTADILVTHKQGEEIGCLSILQRPKGQSWKRIAINIHTVIRD